MSNLPRRVARRAYRTLMPGRWQETIDAARVERHYHLNTEGLGPNPVITEWFARNARPVSIVIPSYNDIPLLTEALASVRDTCAGIDYEVIIVDDFIDPVVSAQLREFESDRVTVVFKEERRGFAGTVNVGMQRARHDIVLLNSDIVAQEGWLQALQYAAYAIDEKIGMVSAKLVYPDGRIQYGGTYYARLLAPQWFGHLHVGSPATKPTANVPGYNRSVSGACVYITRQAYETVGLLDDEYWLGFEDVDYGLRAWHAGVRCYYQPASLLVHHESATRGYSQGHRELGSMRRFWRRWSDGFLTRSLPDDAPVDLVVGPGSTPLWHAYVASLADALRTDGRDVLVREVAGAGPDETVVADAAARGGIVVACDWTAAESVWLATATSGMAVYLLPSIESGSHPDDPALQASIVAGYRPEFDYIAPNRSTQRLLQRETAWESRARVAPALRPGELPDDAARVVVAIAAPAAERERLATVAKSLGAELVTRADVAAEQDVADVAGLRPRAVVSFLDDENSLVPSALMAIGAVYVSPRNERLSHEVMDGYNALLFDDGDLDALERAVTDALIRDEVWGEIRANAHESTRRLAAAAGPAVSRALIEFSRLPV